MCNFIKLMTKISNKYTLSISAILFHVISSYLLYWLLYIYKLTKHERDINIGVRIYFLIINLRNFIFTYYETIEMKIFDTIF
jgi:hypothetical protein